MECRSIVYQHAANRTQSLTIYMATARVADVVRWHRDDQLIALISQKYLPLRSYVRRERDKKLREAVRTNDDELAAVERKHWNRLLQNAGAEVRKQIRSCNDNLHIRGCRISLGLALRKHAADRTNRKKLYKSRVVD